MQNKLLLYNSVSALVFQITTVLCGFILPKLILVYFGSDINGLINSVGQFLGVISFFELGIGAVIQTSLYKPLADNDLIGTSKVISSANRFFRKLGYALLIYVGVVVCLYPVLVNQKFSFWFIASLIVAMSIRFFAQYFFGIVNRLLLIADQKAYIQYNAQTIAVIVNTIVCYILMKLDCSVQIIYGTTSLIFFIQPALIHLYVRKHYSISRNITYDVEPIKQKWNGVAQHIVAFILDGTDIVVISLFSTLNNVSIYSVYILVIKGVKQLFLSMISGFDALIGNLWAKQELEELKNVFSWTEWIIHTTVVFFFTVTAVLIVPFVEVFTLGISDADYFQPIFGVTIVLAYAIYCLSLPYLIMILAVGHYKQTQYKFVVAAVINIVVSVICVKQFGLIGVALGTLAAMAYQTVWMAWYNSKNFINWPMKSFFKQIGVDAVSAVGIFVAGSCFAMSTVSYLSWIILATKVTIIGLFIVLSANIVFYRQNIQVIFLKMKRFFRKVD